MKTFHVRCPVCGTVNRNLYLEETEGWMECECCGTPARVAEELVFSEQERRILPFLKSRGQTEILSGMA